MGTHIGAKHILDLYIQRHQRLAVIVVEGRLVAVLHFLESIVRGEIPVLSSLVRGVLVSPQLLQLAERFGN